MDQRFDNTARTGVVQTSLIINSFKWIFREQQTDDMGIDAHIEIVEKGNPTGLLIAAQIKTGAGNFKGITETKLTYYGTITHLNYWLDHSLPVILIAHMPDEGKTYWQAINDHTIKYTSKGFKVDIPKSNLLEQSRVLLRGLVRPTSWEVNSDFMIRVVNKDNSNLLQHLFDVLKFCEKKMPYIPVSILARVHPFRIESIHHNYSYAEGFCIYTNNQELWDLFNNVDFERLRFRSTEKYRNDATSLKKLRYIVERLRNNLVFGLQMISGGELIQFGGTDSPQLGPLEYYKKLDWKKCLAAVSEKDMSILRAHTLFQLGDYKEAFKIYYHLYLEAKHLRNKLSAFLLLHSLHHVAIHLNFRNIEDIYEVVTKIRAIEIEQQYFTFEKASRIDLEIARFVRNADDMTYYGDRIKKKVDAIREHYETQVRGVSNENFHFLWANFEHLDAYVRQNGVAFHRYTDFYEICNDFTKGVFLSLALNQYQTSKLDGLDGDLLHALILYGKAGQMISLYTRYVKSRISYKANGDGELERIILSHFSIDNDTLNEILQEHRFELSIEFYRITWNVILLLALVDFEATFVQQCVPGIMKLLEKMPNRETHHLNHLGSFVDSNGHKLTVEQLKQLLDLVIEKPFLHSRHIFNAFKSIREKCVVTLLKGKEALSRILNFIEEKKCEKCGRYHEEMIYDLYCLLGEEEKLEIEKVISNRLTENFDFTFYYRVSIHGIIASTPLFEKALEVLSRPKNEEDMFRLGEISFRKLNELLNLSFRFNLEISSEFIDKMKGYSPYYDWLLDMERFDYEYFNPLWILQYVTQPFLEKIFSFENVRKKVRIYLKANYQPTLANYYAQYVS